MDAQIDRLARQAKGVQPLLISMVIPRPELLLPHMYFTVSLPRFGSSEEWQVSPSAYFTVLKGAWWILAWSALLLNAEHIKSETHHSALSHFILHLERLALNACF